MSMGYGPPQVAFYDMLSGLGDQIQKNAALRQQQDVNAARSQAVSQFSQLDPNSPDYGRQVQTIAGQLHPDDSEGAFKFIGLAHQAQRDAQTDKHQAFSENMATRADKRASAAEGRAADEDANTPYQYAKNPKYGQPGEPEYIDVYAAAKAAGENAGNGGIPQVGLNPAYGVGPDGKVAAIQFSKSGKAVQTQLPEGFSLSKEPIRVDSGTHITLIDPITRQTIGVVPKNIAGAEAEKEVGSAQGLAQVALPQTIATSQQILKTIDEVQNHPGKAYSLGLYSKVPTIPGTPQADFRAKAAQLQGQTFLQAYQTLRGSGAITDIEGAKGTAALAALDQAQSTEAYDKALNEFKTVIKAGMLRAAAKARLEGKPPPEMPQYQPEQPARLAPPPAAIDALKKDPRRAADFDAYYGAGSADAVLRGR